MYSRILSVVLAIFFLQFGFQGCKEDKDTIDNKSSGSVVAKQGKTIVSKNIIVLVDLSNRILRQNIVDDPAIVDEILKITKTYFKESIQNNTSDRLYIRSINKLAYNGKSFEDSLRIDLEHFKDSIKSKSDYLFCRKIPCLDKDMQNISEMFKKLYLTQKEGNQVGADIWQYFQQELRYPLICTDSKPLIYDGMIVPTKCQNYIILLTDGYIETTDLAKTLPVNINPNITITLTGQQIATFRNKFNSSGFHNTNLKAFFESQKYGIQPVDNRNLSDAKILVLELDDRTSDSNIQQFPTDMEIIKLFWQDWLEKSGFKPENITLEHRRNSLDDINKIISAFLK